jgi:hypothetical protein
VIYAREFFDLQLRFSAKVAQIANIPPAQALLDYTNLYVRLGLGRAFDAMHPGWQEFVTGLETAPEPAAWIVRFLKERSPDPSPPDVIATVGCFSYGRLDPTRIRIHFHNVEPPGTSPLSDDRMERRLHELGMLFHQASEAGEVSSTVVGTSWLYNLPAYRRLFPATYLASATLASPRFRNMPLWGQFLQRDGSVRKTSSRIFLDRLSRQETLEHLSSCFPLQPLYMEAPVSDFLAFHGTPSRALDWNTGDSR